MPKWQRIRQNDAGEWAVTDLRRGYRICAFHHPARGGVHVHHPVEAARRASVRPVDLESCEEAEAVKRAYAAEHATFAWAAFEECVETWRSTSKND